MSKIVLIIGASKGIGLEIARMLKNNGNIVYGTSRNPAQNPTTEIELIPLDVADIASISKAITYVIEKTGRIDVVINNAGYDLYGAFEDMTLDEFSAQMDTNFWGTVRVTQVILPIMRQQKSGKIINISSLGGVASLPFNSAYSASKFALEGFSESLRYEVLPFNIFISLVEPGQVATDTLDGSIRSINHSTTYDAQKIATWSRGLGAKAKLKPHHVAHTVNKIVTAKHPRLRYYVGTQTRMITLFTRFLPQRLSETMLMRQLVQPFLNSSSKRA
ncbi:MAG: SDR family oxidoreductase [bacterium]|nr:SDR family oxidoreductase [bacterium]